MKSTICLEELKKIEELEYKYLNQIDNVMRKNIDYIISVFRRRFLLYDHWKQFLETEKKRITDLGIGAERVFWKVFSSAFPQWKPVPLFIGSNLFFETDDAFINIDIKTVYIDNLRDYGGLVEVGEAQTSYPMKKTYGARYPFLPKIKTYYVINGIKKYSLAYFIQIGCEKPEIIIEKNLDKAPIFILLVSMPNGLLYRIYGDDIVFNPKSYHTRGGRRFRPANYRYYYHKNPFYKCLADKKCRYRVRLYFNRRYYKYRREVYTSSNQRKEIIITPEFVLKLKRPQDEWKCYLRFYND